MKIAILTREDYRSPRILAESLKLQLEQAGAEVVILYDIHFLNRLVSYKKSKLSFHFWLQKKITHWFSDQQIIKSLKKMDAVVISECIPNGFWKHLYNVEKLKSILQKPVFIYEVYYLRNAPTQIAALQKNKDALLERYDGHLFVSPVTEIREKKTSNAFCIGLMAKTWELQPQPKNELIALVDFVQPGYERYREMQINVLIKAGIPFISLERRYTIEEIRDTYRRVSIFFLQFPEAFGLPILECLCSGAQIFTPDSSWPMSWRLDTEPEVHGKGQLPSCFTVYADEVDLLHKLLLIKENYNLKETPLTVFNNFIENYPSYYEGNTEELNRALDYIKKLIH